MVQANGIRTRDLRITSCRSFLTTGSNPCRPDAVCAGHGTDNSPNAQYSARLRAWRGEQGIVPEWTFMDPSAASFITQL
ncbi:hypothetical protein ACWD6P_32615 [Streptomyces sp. NPDC002446]